MARFSKHLVLPTICLLVFCALVVSDITPWIRGPNDSGIPARWPYYFVNTVNKLWAPLFAVTLLLVIYSIFEKTAKRLTKKKEFLLLGVTVIATLMFHLSLVYFSRFGITILFRRIASPEMNGYFTAATQITDTRHFFSIFPTINMQLYQHAPTHPPGTIAIMKSGITLFEEMPNLTTLVLQFVKTPKDSYLLWSTLTSAQQACAIAFGFLSHLLGVIVLFPLYYCVKMLTNRVIALRTIFIFALIPSFSFFATLFDPFYLFFPLVSCFSLLIGIQKQKKIFFFLTGFFLGISYLFSLSVTPLGFFVGIVLLMWIIKNKAYKTTLIPFLYFCIGLTCCIFLLAVYGLDLPKAMIAASLAPTHKVRSYILSVFFNPYDFFVFLSIPITTIFLFGLGALRKNNVRNYLFAFWITLVVLSLSGATRGEVGRLWIGIMWIPIALTMFYTTVILKWKTKEHMFLLLLIVTQTLLLEEFWVPVW